MQPLRLASSILPAPLRDPRHAPLQTGGRARAPLASLLALLLLLGGCAATLPRHPAQDAVLSAGQVAQTYALDPDWWRRYDLPALDATMELALTRNVNLAKAAITVNKALYQARLIGADLLPAFSADGSAGASRRVDTSSPSARSFQGSVGLSYELDLWRRLHYAASAQEWEYSATLDDLAGARLALINSVADTWFNMRYLEQAILLTGDNVARYAHLADILRIKYAGGKVAAVEPLQAEQSLLSAQNRLIDLKTKYSAAGQTLRDLLNLRPDEKLPGVTLDLMGIASVPVDLDVPVAALGARPDIHAAEARLNKAFSSLESQRRAWYPQVSLGSTLSVSADSARTFFDVPMLAGLVKVSFPFLDWNTLRWNTKISEADFETAKLSFTSAVTTALNEVDAAYIAYANARRTLENVLDKEAKDSKIVQYYQARYDLGATELKDYLDAQNTADSSALASLEAKYQALSQENAIYKAMGGRMTPKAARTN